MKFRKGDRVSFLNDIGGGTVNRVDEKGYVYVITADGFEIPVPEKELVHSASFSLDDRNSGRREPEKPKETAAPKKKEPEKSITIPRDVPANAQVNILVGFIPVNEGPVFNNTIGCYLINDSPLLLYYLAGKKSGGKLHHLSSGIIEPDTKNFLAEFDQTGLSKISDIHVQVLFVSGGIYLRRQPLDTMVNLNLVNFSKESYYRENEYFSEKAVIFDLGNPDFRQDDITIPDEVIEQKMQADRVSKPRKNEPVTDTLEVDLHYDGEGLANSNLTPSAILALQMSRFHAAVEEAISKNMRRLVVIHGVGQGTLKMQIRNEIQEKYPRFIFQDASFKEYGFGATMIHLVI